MTKAHFFSPPTAPQSNPLMTVGFCVNREGEANLLASGIPEHRIWMRGRGAESLDYALRYFRDTKGVLAVADDLRIFGPTRKDIMSRMGDLHERGITIRDVVMSEENPHALAHRALTAISASSGTKDHRTARKRGRSGGIGKGIAAQVARDKDVPQWLVRNIVNDRDIPWDVKMRVLDNKFSQSTLRRRYAEKT